MPIKKRVEHIIGGLERIGFSVSSVAHFHQTIFTANDLSRALTELAAGATVALDELEMSDFTMHRMLAKIRFTSIRLQHTTAGTTAIVDFSTRNSFPVLGIELWLKKRPRLPAGFVKISSSSKEMVDSVRMEVARLLSIVLKH